MCVCLTQRGGATVEAGTPPRRAVKGECSWCYCADMSESSGPAARGRVMRAVPVWRCLFRGHQEVSN